MDDRVRVRGWFLALQALELAVAAVGLLAFGWAGAGLNFYLPTVDPRGGADSGKPVDLTWLALVSWLLLTLVASTGLPRRSTGGGLRRARGGGGAAAVQLIGGLVMIGGTLLAYVVSHPYGFSGPDIPCTYTSCWPLRPQAVGLMVPGLAAGAAAVVMALLVDRCSWLTRAIVPAALWLVLLVLQKVIWAPYLLPILQGPPR